MMRVAAATACAIAVAQFTSHAHALLPGSHFALRFADGREAAYATVVGPGAIVGGEYVVPESAAPASVALVAAASTTLAFRALRVAPPPRHTAIAVASYDDGIVFHDPRTFAVLGTLSTGGAPSDVAALGNRVDATDTDGDAITSATLDAWRVGRVAGIPLGNEIAADTPLRAFFVSERDLDGKGGLARIRGGVVRTVVTGTTAEGVVVDERRQRVYVSDPNDDTVSILDARSMHVVGRIGGLPRAFSLALSPDGARLFVVSNQGSRTPLAAPGGVSEIALAPRPHVIARSRELTFPLGIALDPRSGTLFVTDEQSDEIYVLDDRSLRARATPLHTCRTPWKPDFDASSGRLFVPCARSDEVDAFDARTLARVRGAPFHTGGYPLGVAIVRP